MTLRERVEKVRAEIAKAVDFWPDVDTCEYRRGLEAAARILAQHFPKPEGER